MSSNLSHKQTKVVYGQLFDSLFARGIAPNSFVSFRQASNEHQGRTDFEAAACETTQSSVSTWHSPPLDGTHGEETATPMCIPILTISNTQCSVLQHACKTQPPPQVSLRGIYVGDDGNNSTASRWVRGSMITFNTNRATFPNAKWAGHAAKCLEKAARAWNKGDIGVSFLRVPDHEPAVFQLTFSDNERTNRGWLAEAFFPYEVLYGQQPKLRTFRLAFEQKMEYDNMANILCHELGHILGLRHEFAQRDEMAIPSVMVGSGNEKSVMNYFADPSQYRIQKSDYIDTKEFYAFRGEQYNGFTIEDVIPMVFVQPPCSFHSEPSTVRSLIMMEDNRNLVSTL